MAWLEFGLSNALAATALAAVALVVTRSTRRPQLAFVVWLLVLAKLLVPPLVSVPLASLRSAPPPSDESVLEGCPSEPCMVAADAMREPLPEAPANTVDASAADHSEFPAPRLPESSLEPVTRMFAFSPPTLIFAAWVLGSTLWLVVAATRIGRFRRTLSYAEQASPALQREVQILAERLGVRRVPEVRLVKRRIPPLVWAMFGAPVILLPAGLLRILSPMQRATLLVHELAHLKRRDHLARMLELAALGLYWWHPVVWWARRNVERAAEQCCDAEVVAHMPDAAGAYACALLATVDFLSEARPPMPLLASGFSQAVHVKRRMEMILKANPTRRSTWPVRLVLVAFALVVLPLSLRALWAEPVQPSDEPAAESARESAAVSDDPKPKSGRVQPAVCFLGGGVIAASG
ncbi:MAG: M56 family metallopeptidase, partial [Pirellulales bacterium]